MLFTFNFCIPLSSHNVQNMVDDNYLVLFTSLCCPHVAGFQLRENAVGELSIITPRTEVFSKEMKKTLH
jgi:hypothetical protein